MTKGPAFAPVPPPLKSVLGLSSTFEQMLAPSDIRVTVMRTVLRLLMSCNCASAPADERKSALNELPLQAPTKPTGKL